MYAPYLLQVVTKVATETVKSVAIIGAGKLGTVIARLAANAGYRIYIAGSGSPEKIALSMKFIAPKAVPATTAEAVSQAEIVILALPLSKSKNLPVEKFSGKLVIDAMNYWWEVDGKNPGFIQSDTSSSESVQLFLTSARVVKALSHMGYHHLFDEARPPGHPERKAIAVAGNSSTDNNVVATFIDELGFDPVIIGNLKAGKILEPGNPLFGANITKRELREIAQS